MLSSKTTLETGAQLLIVAFKTTKTKYGDTFIICTRDKTNYNSYWSTAQLTAYLSKIMQDGRNKLDLYKNKLYYLLEGSKILVMLKIAIRDIIINKNANNKCILDIATNNIKLQGVREKNGI